MEGLDLFIQEDGGKGSLEAREEGRGWGGAAEVHLGAK